jgi:branched-subunit amino acid ABC-type transport system permease component
MLNVLIPSLADGLLVGFVYGVAAMGLTLIWGVMNVVNLAHGPIMTLGMFGVYLMFSIFGINPYLGLIVVAVAGLVFGIALYFIGVHRVIDAPHLSSLLSTFAINMVIVGVGTALYSTSPYNVDFTLGSVTIGAITVPWTRIAAAGGAILVSGLLYLFLSRTRVGKYIRAVSNNRPSAELMGIPSSQVLALSFGIGVMLAAIAGGLTATMFPFSILSGGSYQLKSFVIVVLGGLGNPVGALVGGLVLGLLEGAIPAFLPSTWVPVFEFGLFVIILLARPSGLLGRRQ